MIYAHVHAPDQKIARRRIADRRVAGAGSGSGTVLRALISSQQSTSHSVTVKVTGLAVAKNERERGGRRWRYSGDAGSIRNPIPVSFGID